MDSTNTYGGGRHRHSKCTLNIQAYTMLSEYTLRLSIHVHAFGHKVVVYVYIIQVLVSTSCH